MNFAAAFVGGMDCVIPSQPHQPPASFTFPKRSFGKKAPVLHSGLSSGLFFTMMKLKILYIATLVFYVLRRSD